MNEDNDSFIRWQGITINQFTYAQNLILTFSVAALGFGLSMIKDQTFAPLGLGKCLFTLSLISLSISIGCGLCCVINRLKDFRVTKTIAKNRGNDDSSEISELREISRNLGRRTWNLFRCQIGIFSLGILLLTIGIILIYGNKLF